MTGLSRLKYVFAALLAVSACEEGLRPERSIGTRFADQQQWSAALGEYRSQLAKNPDSAEALQGYYATVEKAEEFIRKYDVKVAHA